MVPPAHYTEKTGFHRVHRTLDSTGPVRPVSGSSEDAGAGLRPDAGGVRSVLLTWQRTEEIVSDRTLGESGRAGPDASGRSWNLTGSDQTLGSCVRSWHCAASSHLLNVGIRRSVFEERNNVATIR